MFRKNDVSKLLRVHVHVRQFVHHSLLDYHFGEIILAGGAVCCRCDVIWIIKFAKQCAILALDPLQTQGITGSAF